MKSRFRELVHASTGACHGSVFGLCGSQAQAHHSLSFFDQAQIKMVHGTIAKVSWAAPHSWLWLKADDGVVWPLESGSPMQLAGTGYRPCDLAVGGKLSVLVHPLRDGRLGGSLVALKLDHGRAVQLPDGVTLAAAD